MFYQSVGWEPSQAQTRTLPTLCGWGANPFSKRATVVARWIISCTSAISLPSNRSNVQSLNLCTSICFSCSWMLLVRVNNGIDFFFLSLKKKEGNYRNLLARTIVRFDFSWNLSVCPGSCIDLVKGLLELLKSRPYSGWMISDLVLTICVIFSSFAFSLYSTGAFKLTSHKLLSYFCYSSMWHFDKCL